GVTLAPMLIAVGLLSVGSGAVSSMSSALTSLAADSESQGQTLSLVQSFGGLGRVVGPLAAGWVFAAGGAGAPFLAGGVLTLAALLVALPLIPLRQTPETSAVPASASMPA
ncbi:MAG: MFS transporter, partial [Chloroflexota bacterium]|nr:MFS transporter [Chloroflexota bacterium]